MSIASWPLSGELLLNEWQKSPQDNRVSFKPEIGPALTRRRGTARIVLWSATYRLRGLDALEDFEEWFKDDIKDGTLPFEMEHPLSCETRRFKFGEALYQVAPRSRKTYALSVTLEELP